MIKLVITLMVVQAYGNLLAVGNVTSTVLLRSSGARCVWTFGEAGIRDDYQYSPGIGYHKLHTRAKTWNEARKICYDEGGHLAIINSAAEASILRKMLATETNIVRSANENWTYIGIHDFFKEGDWTTVLGAPMARTGYDQWVNHEPNNYNNNEQCGAFIKQGGLYDVNCNNNYAFFCEIPDLR